MFKKIISTVLAAVMVICTLPMAATLAATETADFEGLGFADLTQISESTAIEGFKFTTSAGQGIQYLTTLGASGTAGVVAMYSGPIGWLEFRRNDGVDFALRSIWYNATAYTGSTQYRFDGYKSGSVIKTTGNVAISATNTISFTGWDQVDTVRITATAGGDLDVAAVFDNIVYETTTVSTVPYVDINNTVTVSEGGTVSVTNSYLKAADNDSVASSLQYTVTTGLTHGRLENSDNPGTPLATFTQGNIDSGKIRYVHDHSDTTSDSFVFKISDGTNELTNQTFHITVTPVYDDPIPVGASVATFDNLSGTYTNGTAISYSTAINGFVFRSSADLGMTYYSSGGQDNTPALKTTGTSGITSLSIKRSDSSVFKLFTMFLYDNGTTGSTLYTFKGYLGGSEVYSKADVNVKTPVTVTFNWENIDEIRVSVTGTDADIVASFDNIVYQDTSVSPVPYVEINNALTVNEGGTVSITNSSLKAADNDSVASSLQYTVTGALAHGRIENSDSPGVAITTFTQGNIDSGKIRYVHDHGDTTSDSFVFKVSDGTHEVTGQTFSITVTPVYDDPIPAGASVATFDDLGGTYYSGEAIPYTTAIDGFLFRSSADLGMTYYSSGSQDNTPALRTSGSSGITSLSIKKSDGAGFKLITMFLYDDGGTGSALYTFKGYLGGGEVYTKADVNVKSRVKVTFDWENIDEIRVSVTGTGADIAALFDNIVYQNNNAGPVASDVLPSGTVTYGRTLNGSYTFSDAESDAQGTSTFKWYRADNAAGLNKTAISGAESQTYLLSASDVGKYIGFGVTPIAVTGTVTGSEVIVYTSAAVQKATPTITTVPTASAITYEQTLSDSTLTGGSASVAGTFSWTTGTTEPSVSDSGTTAYSVTFTPTDSTNYNTATTSVTLTVNKATPVITTSPSASAITYGEALSDSTLTGGSASAAGTFSWTTGTTEPSVSDSGTTAYSITFTPSDSTNYNTATTAVTLTVNKATPAINTAPSASAITYGETLSDSTLTGGAASVAGTFSWTTGTTLPSVSDSGTTAYSVTFTPADSSNYGTATTTVTLTVSKATPIISMAPTASSITYGETLSDSTLTTGSASVTGTFSWTAGTTAPSVSDSGTTAYSVTFTPTDSINYRTVTTTVTLTVNKATPIISTAPSASSITYGQELSDSTLTGGSASVAGTFSWTTDTISPSVSDSGVTVFSVTFTPTDSANYNTTTTTVIVTVNKETPTISTVPSASAITYGETLSDSALTGGSASVAGTFSWTTGTTEPSVSDSGTTAYSVTFTPTDSANYGTATTTVTLTVNKATPTISTAPTASGITYRETLSDSTLTGGSASAAGTFSWTTGTTEPSVSDSGTTAYSITFTPSDSTNYNTATTAVTLTVNKATPAINTAPTASGITYRETLSDSTLTGGSASVAGTFSWTTGTTEPSVSDSGTTAYSVTFTPTDSANYGTVTTTVTLTVNKATPTISTAPSASAITYGETLSDSTLTGGSASVAGTFSWTAGTTEPSVSDSGTTAYSVTFTPTDSANYGTATTTVTLTVNKAMPTVSIAPSASAITYGETLSDSTLTGGSASIAGTFSWTIDTISPSISDSGTTAYSVTFSPTDSSNYNTTPMTATLTVNKATPTITTAPSVSAITYGETLSDSILTGGSANAAGTFSWTTDTISPSVSDSGVTAYSITFTPTDSANYNTTTMTVTVTVNKETTTISTAPSASAITYRDTLSDSTLTGGSASIAGTFSWTTGTTEPSVSNSGVTGYSVTFTPTDSANYGTATTTVTLTVNKATPTISTAPTASGITYGKELSSSTLSGGLASVAGTFSWTIDTINPSVSDSGVTAYSVTFKPADSDNHNTTTTTVTLTVNKATPTISASPAVSGITYGEELSDSTLTGGLASVAGTFSWTVGTTKPSVSDSDVTGYSVTFTPMDSDSYGTATTTVTLTVNKANAVSPVAPSLSGKTQTTVTLTFITGYEYIKVINGADLSTGTWQDSNVLSGLTSGTEYDFYQRIKETATHKASDTSSKLDVTTSAASTATPTATPTAIPTAIPSATATLVPTVTPTPMPETTGIPKPTSIPTATATPVPTSDPTSTESSAETTVVAGTDSAVLGTLSIKGVLLDADGNPMAGYLLELHSVSLSAVTDANGQYAFSNVTFAHHVLVVKTADGVQIAAYELDFTKGEQFLSNVTQTGVNITYTDDTAAINIELMLTKGQDGAAITQVSGIDGPANDTPPDNMIIIPWLAGGVLVICIVTGSLLLIRGKRKRTNRRY